MKLKILRQTKNPYLKTLFFNFTRPFFFPILVLFWTQDLYIAKVGDPGPSLLQGPPTSQPPEEKDEHSAGIERILGSERQTLLLRLDLESVKLEDCPSGRGLLLTRSWATTCRSSPGRCSWRYLRRNRSTPSTRSSASTWPRSSSCCKRRWQSKRPSLRLTSPEGRAEQRWQGKQDQGGGGKDLQDFRYLFPNTTRLVTCSQAAGGEQRQSQVKKDRCHW